MGKGELDGVFQELLDGNTTDLRSVDGLDVNDLDGGVTSAVTASHVVVELSDGSDAGDVTELLVHVVDSLARSVTKPDSVVLDRDRLLLDLVDGEDLSVGGLKLVQLAHEVPEARTGNDVVGREKTHAEDGGVGNSLSGL